MKKLYRFFSLLLITVMAFTFTQSYAADLVYFNDVENPKTIEEIKDELIATDDIDGDISDSITILLDNYTGNETIIGDYLVYFEVTDSGNQTTQQIVTVRNVDINSPVISYEDTALLIPEGDMITLSSLNLVATDGYEGDLTASINVTGWEGVDTSTIGSYDILVYVSDNSGNETTETLTIEVIDDVIPVIDGPDVFVKRPDYLFTAASILEYYTAADNIDGDVTDFIEIASNDLLGHADEVGAYDLILRVTDSAGNVTLKSVQVIVNDDIKPLLVIDSTRFVISQQETFTESDFVATLKLIGDIPNKTYVTDVVQDTYTENATVTGEYRYYFELLSTDGNDYVKNIDVDVIEYDVEFIEQDPGFVQNTMDHVKTWWWVYGIVIVIGVGIFKK